MTSCKRRHRGVHAARDRALQQAARWMSRLAQHLQLVAEFIKQACETPCRGVIGRAHIRLAAARLDDQVDRAVLQMQPLAVSQQLDLRGSAHVRGPGAGGCGDI